MAFKLKEFGSSEEESNSGAARKFGVDEKRVRKYSESYKRCPQINAALK